MCSSLSAVKRRANNRPPSREAAASAFQHKLHASRLFVCLCDQTADEQVDSHRHTLTHTQCHSLQELHLNIYQFLAVIFSQTVSTLAGALAVHNNTHPYVNAHTRKSTSHSAWQTCSLKHKNSFSLAFSDTQRHTQSEGHLTHQQSESSKCFGGL